jgi:hypothetical protein
VSTDGSSSLRTAFGEEEIAALMPAGAEVLDAHTHLGVDEDGQSLAPKALIELLDVVGPGAKACTFALHDPERQPAYRVPNDRVLAAAAESGGRLIPYCRLDPSDGAEREAERCLGLGARGIKLHPRAQSFGFGSDVADGVFRIARDAGVPILIHAGRGMPPMDPLAELAQRYPEVPLVLAHAGIAGQGMFASKLADHPATLYDTSCFSVADVVELFARVPAERIVLASDTPYGRPVGALFMCLRVAALAGLGDGEVRGLLGGTMASVLAGAPLAAPRLPRLAESRLANGRLMRVGAYLTMGFGAIMGGDRGPDPARALPAIALARCVARDPDPGYVAEPLARIDELLARAEVEIEAGMPRAMAAFGFVQGAAIIAGTEPPQGTHS